jgi:integrase
VDFGAETVRLEPGQTKNGDGRMCYFTPELRALLEAQRATTKATATKLERIIQWVFHRHGAPIKSFRRAWLTACLDAGFATLVSEKPRVIKPHRIFHDFRRTAVRNLERAGVSRSVAMKLTGHKTEAVYRRYAIVSDSDPRAAAAKLAAASERAAIPTGTVFPFRAQLRRDEASGCCATY